MHHTADEQALQNTSLPQRATDRFSDAADNAIAYPDHLRLFERLCWLHETSVRKQVFSMPWL